MSQIKCLAALQFVELEGDLVGANGRIIAARGDRIILLPQTLADAVQFADGESLPDKWRELGRRFAGAGPISISQQADGTIVIDSEATTVPYAVMVGASEAEAGQKGLVPAPAAGTQDKYLRGDGTWQEPPDTTYDPATQSANGLMSSADKKKLDGIATGAQVNPAAATAAPKAHGTAAVGTSARYAREDHVHPSNNTDTHWTSHLYVGAASGNANAATLNGATYLMILDNSTVRDRRLIKGTGSVTVTSDANGVITISGTWRGIQNNLTSTATDQSLSAAQGKALANGSARDNTKLPLAGGSMTGTISSSVTTGTHINGNKGVNVIINSTAAGGNYNILARLLSKNGVFCLGTYQQAFMLYYTAKNVVDAGTNTITKAVTLLNENGDSTFPGQISALKFLLTDTSTIKGANKALVVQETDMAEGTAPSASIYRDVVRCLDKNGTAMGAFQICQMTNKEIGWRFYTQRKVNNAWKYGIIGVWIDVNGNVRTEAAVPPDGDNSGRIATANWAIGKRGNRGALAGYETASALSNSQTITSTSSDCINLTTSGAVTLTFTAAAANVRAVKVLCLTASAATTLTIKNAVWANKGSAPAWGNKGAILVLVAHFVGGRVVLSVFDNTQ